MATVEVLGRSGVGLSPWSGHFVLAPGPRPGSENLEPGVDFIWQLCPSARGRPAWSDSAQKDKCVRTRISEHSHLRAHGGLVSLE